MGGSHFPSPHPRRLQPAAFCCRVQLCSSLGPVRFPPLVGTGCLKGYVPPNFSSMAGVCLGVELSASSQNTVYFQVANLITSLCQGFFLRGGSNIMYFLISSVPFFRFLTAVTQIILVLDCLCLPY